MILAIDIGNTNVVVGCIQNEKILHVGRIESDDTYTIEVYCGKINEILDMGVLDVKLIEGSIISSVVPKLTSVLEKAAAIITKSTPLIVSPGLKTDLKLQVQNPNQLGSDRIADAVAATYYYNKPVVIIDMGTATTVSVVDEKHNFLGGMIMLGVKSSMEALASKAAQLPKVDLEETKNLIGKNTVQCIQSGSIYGHAAMVDGIIHRLKQQLDKPVTIVATGGLAPLIIPHCEEAILYDEHLLLKGLYLLYIKNFTIPA